MWKVINFYRTRKNNCHKSEGSQEEGALLLLIFLKILFILMGWEGREKVRETNIHV